MQFRIFRTSCSNLWFSNQLQGSTPQFQRLSIIILLKVEIFRCRCLNQLILAVFGIFLVLIIRRDQQIMLITGITIFGHLILHRQINSLMFRQIRDCRLGGSSRLLFIPTDSMSGITRTMGIFTLTMME